MNRRRFIRRRPACGEGWVFTAAPTRRRRSLSEIAAADRHGEAADPDPDDQRVVPHPHDHPGVGLLADGDVEVAQRLDPDAGLGGLGLGRGNQRFSLRRS